MKARVSYPKAESGRNDHFATEVLQGYAGLPEMAKSDVRRLPPDLEKLAELLVPVRGAFKK
jgi:hypothetical protein